MRRFLVAASLVSLFLGCFGYDGETSPPPTLPAPAAGPSAPLSYRSDVQPVLDARCVVCHGCYDAPCQLLFSSQEGVERGASKEAVYHSDRLTAAEPTRLGIDEPDTAGWRRRGFFSALEAPESGGGQSLLQIALAAGRARPFATGQKLPGDLPLDITRELSCPTAAEAPEHFEKRPQSGMPYGMAPLPEDQLAVLAAFAADPSPPEPAPALSDALLARISTWELFLNGASLREKVVARYLFEHWLFADLTFDDQPSGPFFRVVRSKTPPGQPIDEIASRRPYDPPGVETFWYRLQRLDETIVHKSHIVYAIGHDRMERLRELFYEPAWEVETLPAYGVREASNPFVSFEMIPARSRYQFLLDDAQYFLMTFIRGPVCRGQTAVDVIEDQFFVVFLDPDSDLSVVDPEYLERAKETLRLPAENVGRFHPGGLWLEFQIAQKQYLDLRQQAYDALDPQRRGPSLEAIWDGDGSNTDAQLTVFRHFDNATVVRGFVGGISKTAWVIDFPIFERIYYDLVANFDVFGNVTHQISTRLYMDHLRMQSENLFLAFLPEPVREPMRASWYVGATGKDSYKLDPLVSLGHGTQISYATDDPKRELIELILARNPAVSGPPDRLNRCGSPPCDRPGATPAEQRIERALQPLADVTGPWVRTLPELSFLRVRAPSESGGAVVYSLVHNRAHTNVASMFDEKERLVPEDDTLTVVRGTLGSYPNFAFDVDVEQIDAFATALGAVRNDADLEVLVARWGVRRTSPKFWATIDWLHDDFRRRAPGEAGLFDLNRYQNL